LSPSKGYLRPDSSRVLEVMNVGANVGARVMSLEPSQDFESRRGERLRRAYEISRDRESIVRGFESRQFERSRVDGSRVREFERSSSTVM
jgi:hypothetical protein